MSYFRKYNSNIFDGFGAMGEYRVDPVVTQANFDEAFYLAQNPDVVAFMAANPHTFKSGWDHFSQGGRAEGRSWRSTTISAWEAQPNPIPIVLTDPATTAVMELYARYLHRTATSANPPDPAGVQYWANVWTNDGAAGPANVERGFRVQAVNDGVYTEGTLPYPLHFTLSPNVDPSGEYPQPPVPVVEGPGIFDNLTETITGQLDEWAASLGVERQTLVMGAAALGIGLFIWANSDGGTKRKR